MSETHEKDPQFVWDTMKGVGVAMVITRDGAALDGRPMQSYPCQDEGVVYFMTGQDGRLVAQVETDGRVLLCYSEQGHSAYAAVDGTAEMINDRDKVAALWNVWAQAFWKSPDDPSIRLLVFRPEHARYWESAGTLATAIAMASALVTGTPPELGIADEVQLRKA